MRVLLLTSIILLSSGMQAQSGYIRDRIIGQDNLPLPGATIIPDEEKGAISDRDGFYTILNVTPGARTVMVSYIGFETQSQEFEVVANQTAKLNVKLEGAMELDVFVITGIIRGQAKAFNQQFSNENAAYKAGGVLLKDRLHCSYIPSRKVLSEGGRLSIQQSGTAVNFSICWGIYLTFISNKCPFIANGSLRGNKNSKNNGNIVDT